MSGTALLPLCLRTVNYEHMRLDLDHEHLMCMCRCYHEHMCLNIDPKHLMCMSCRC